MKIDSVGKENGGAKAIFFVLSILKALLIKEPQTPKAATRLYTNPPDEQRGVEYDPENYRAKWYEQSETMISKKTRSPHIDPCIP